MSSIDTGEMVIELTDDWTVFNDNGAIVAHGPENTEVIVTPVVLTGTGSQAERIEALNMSKQRIVDLMRRNTTGNELMITAETCDKKLASGISLTHLSSVASSAAIVFDQFMLTGNRDVLFVTFEGPACADDIRKLVHVAIESTRLR